MGLAVPAGQIETLIGLFYKVNVKKPPAKPEHALQGALERLVIAKGMLQITLGEDSLVDVRIPEEDQVDEETYQGFIPLLVKQIVDLLQIPEHTGNLTYAMQRGGIVAYFQGPTLRINPLSASTGEADQF